MVAIKGHFVSEETKKKIGLLGLTLTINTGEFWTTILQCVQNVTGYTIELINIELTN